MFARNAQDVPKSHSPSIMDTKYQERMKAKGFLPYHLDTLPANLCRKPKRNSEKQMKYDDPLWNNSENAF
ncbi:hypothetical protein TNIN_199131 [Trichonephila inaurata madagascariensis]|uniref:Uncharacterized protein n=1 Tax=Trichonephila inaurata madagascariensis TaxID=2747483 RepID=A0A8X6XNI5_9ARAC|nr:hypothetical protein TNIN_199131 [Trichonephila inaurata madagascariensis]